MFQHIFCEAMKHEPAFGRICCTSREIWKYSDGPFICAQLIFLSNKSKSVCLSPPNLPIPTLFALETKHFLLHFALILRRAHRIDCERHQAGRNPELSVLMAPLP